MFNNDGNTKTQAKSNPQRLIIQLSAQGRAPSHAPDSEEETEKRQALASQVESKRDEKWCS